MTIREAAAEYIAKGWKVVPLAPGSKACKDNDWLRLVFKPEDFQEGDNIGIRSVDGLVDVDNDAPEVVAVASAFLPSTGAVFGRPSKPMSHWWYRTKLDRPIVHKDIGTGGTLIELRVNHQSMAPPSIHPDGEQISWVGQLGDAATVAHDELVRAVRLVATAALIARYYNPPGARHEWGLAVAGFVRQLSITETEAQLILTQAGKYAKDEHLDDRVRAISDTYARQADDPVKGARALEELSAAGKSLIASLRRIWEAESSGIPVDALERLNAKHAIVFQQSGDLVVITEDADSDGRPYLRYSSLQTIRDLYPQPVIIGFSKSQQPLTKKLGQAWLESPRRRFYGGIELAASKERATPGYYNLWRGFSVEPKQGSWSKFHAHIKSVICSDEADIEEYILSWMARCVQEPGRPGQTAVALRGGQGTGKSTFARWFGALFGPHFLHLDSTRHLTGHFNAHLHNAILVFADEAAWPGDKAGLGALRRMITEDTIAIERKGMDVFTVPNVIHLLLASNDDWIVPAALDERRFVVLDVAKTRRNDRKYFSAIEKELFKNGGLAAMLYDLLEYKITINLAQIPHTQALYEQKQMTSSPLRRWWFQVLYDGDFWRDKAGAKAWRVDREAIYAHYVTTLERTGRNYKSLQTELGMFLKKVMPGEFPISKRLSTGQRFWLFPSLKDCRKKYEEEYGVTPSIWTGDDVTQSGELDL